MTAFLDHSGWTSFIATVTVLCFAGCSTTQPTRHVRLALYPPAGAEVEKTRSYEVVRWRVGDSEISLSPRGGLDDLLDVWIAIENKGQNPINLFPREIRYAYCKPKLVAAPKPVLGIGVTGATADWQTATEAVCTAYQPVPEKGQVLAHLDQRDRQRRQADEADETAVALALVLVFVVFVVVVAAASSSGSGSGASGSEGRSRRSNAFGGTNWFGCRHTFSPFTHVHFRDSSSFEAPRLTSAPAFFGGNLDYALNEAVIAPGARHAGHIFIPPDLDATLLRLEIGVNGDTTSVEFDYKPQAARRVATKPARQLQAL